MWVLTHIENGEKKYILRNTLQYTVGRKMADIEIANDQTISRDHAALIPRPGQLLVVDTNSKYGVFVNGDIAKNKAIDKGTQVPLQSGYIVRFGRLNSTWRVELIEYKVITSMLIPDEKTQLQTIIEPLGGILLNEFDDTVTHLVMTDVQFSMKVLQAMVKGIPIVNLAFFTDTVANIETKKALPKPDDYIPPITEPYLLTPQSMVGVNLDRSRLFAGKTFVFMMQRHQAQFEAVICQAQGTCTNMETKRIRKGFLIEKDVIVVKYTASAESQASEDILRVIDYLLSKELRMIGDTEIGLAILYCSIEKFCNPEYRFEALFDGENVPSPSEAIMEDIAHVESVPLLRPMVSETIEIPETEDHEASTSANVKVPAAKRTREEEAGDPKRAKKQKVQATASRSSIDDVVERVEQVEIHSEPLVDAQPEVSPAPSTSKERNQPAHHASSDLFTADTQPLVSLNGFMSSQSRNVRKSTSVGEKSASPPVLAGPKKRAFDALRSGDDDDGDNEEDIFHFEVRSKQKKPRRNAEQNSVLPRQDSEDLFGFDMPNTLISVRSQRTRRSQQQEQAQHDEVSTSSVMAVPPREEPIDKTLSVKPIPFTSGGWIKKKDCNSVFKEEEHKVKIKDEPLDEHEMTRAEINRRWELSLQGSIVVRKLDSSFICRPIDEVDHNGSASTTTGGVKNFKKFVKARNYIPQTIVIKTYPRNG